MGKLPLLIPGELPPSLGQAGIPQHLPHPYPMEPQLQELQDLEQMQDICDAPVLMMYQKSEALNLTNKTLHKEHLHIKLFAQAGLLHDTQQLPTQLRQMKSFPLTGDTTSVKIRYRGTEK
ncbi:hypothetical protein STEG23_025316 [Scotinomys teguina]